MIIELLYPAFHIWGAEEIAFPMPWSAVAQEAAQSTTNSGVGGSIPIMCISVLGQYNEPPMKLPPVSRTSYTTALPLLWAWLCVRMGEWKEWYITVDCLPSMPCAYFACLRELQCTCIISCFFCQSNAEQSAVQCLSHWVFIFIVILIGVFTAGTCSSIPHTF